MNTTNKIILSLVLVVLIGATYYFYAPQRTGVGTNAGPSSSPYEQQVAALRDAPVTNAQREMPLTATGPEKLKIFDITITQTSISPNAIVAEKGDIIQFNVHTDRDVKFESKDLRFSAPVKAGVPYGVSISPMDAGTYAFYAQDGSQTLFGHVVVRPRG